MSKIMCRWCKDILDTLSDPGWYSCLCKTIDIDVTKDYYRILANFEDMEIVEIQIMKNIVKHLWKQIDWNVVLVIVLVGLVPSWLVIGAIFFPMLTSYYGR